MLVKIHVLLITVLIHYYTGVFQNGVILHGQANKKYSPVNDKGDYGLRNI